MKKIILFFLFSFCSCNGQKLNNDNIEKLVTTLDNKSILISFNYNIKYSLDDKAKSIIQLNDKTKLKYLVENLKYNDKAIVSNIILTKILEPNNDIFKTENIFDKDGNVTSIEFIFNKLRCEYFDDKLRIKNFNSEELYSYWNSKIR